MADDPKKFPLPEDLTPEQCARITEFQEKLEAWKRETLARLPLHVQALGPLLRKAVRTGSTKALERFCKKHKIDVPRAQLPAFRDFLITQRFDLKDLEPDARARLRLRTLRETDTGPATQDYLLGIRRGEDLRCRSCRYFVRAPNDGDPNDPNSAKSCVDLGTKGADIACRGFTYPPN